MALMCDGGVGLAVRRQMNGAVVAWGEGNLFLTSADGAAWHLEGLH